MKPIYTAICSFGMSGKVFHAPFISTNLHYQLYGVMERSKNHAIELYPDAIIFRDLETLLADDLIELVIVNTPNGTHYDFAKKALLAGKHVVVEKPFTLTVSEGKELIQIAKEKHLKITVFQNRRFDSDFRTVKKVLDQNLLGKIVDVTIHFDRFKEGIGPKKHKEEPIPGAGTLYDLGAHSIDQALQLFGHPDRIFADIRSVRPGSQVSDEWELLLAYNNMRVRLLASYVVRESVPGYVIHGLLGSFLKARTDVQETLLQQGVLPIGDNWAQEPENEKGILHTKMDGKVIRTFHQSENGNYNDFFNQLYEAIRNGAPLPVLPEQALDVVRVIEKAYQSNREGKWIHF